MLRWEGPVIKKNHIYIACTAIQAGKNSIVSDLRMVTVHIQTYITFYEANITYGSLWTWEVCLVGGGRTEPSSVKTLGLTHAVQHLMKRGARS